MVEGSQRKEARTNETDRRRKKEGKGRVTRRVSFAKQDKSGETRRWADGEARRLCMRPNRGNAAHRLRRPFCK